MSQIKAETIWQHELVLPYILGELKSKIDAITPVKAIYLYGSRARTHPDDWHLLQGKDWDIAMVCDFKITNTRIWTILRNYHIDLSVVTPTQIGPLLQRENNLVQLYPDCQLLLPDVSKQIIYENKK